MPPPGSNDVAHAAETIATSMRGGCPRRRMAADFPGPYVLVGTVLHIRERSARNIAVSMRKTASRPPPAGGGVDLHLRPARHVPPGSSRGSTPAPTISGTRMRNALLSRSLRGPQSFDDVAHPFCGPPRCHRRSSPSAANEQSPRSASRNRPVAGYVQRTRRQGSLIEQVRITMSRRDERRMPALIATLASGRRARDSEHGLHWENEGDSLGHTGGQGAPSVASLTAGVCRAVTVG